MLDELEKEAPMLDELEKEAPMLDELDEKRHETRLTKGGLGKKTLLAAIAAGVFLLAAPEASHGVHCCEDWDEPYICSLDLDFPEREAHRHHEGRQKSEIPMLRLAPREAVRVGVSAIDQNGQAFPQEEVRYKLYGNCGSLVGAEIRSGEGFDLQAGVRSGSCELTIRVAGNRNLDESLRIEVRALQPRDTVQPRKERSEIVAQRLYQAILGRDPSPEELRGVAQIVARGTSETWIRNAFRSEEFRRRSAHLDANELLDSIYAGLLLRDPDPSGARSYLPLLQRGRYAEVVLDILRSSELERSVAEEME